MDNVELLYSLSKSEWIGLLGESLGLWFTNGKDTKVPELNSFCGCTYDLKLINKLYKRGLLTDKGLYNLRCVEFINWLYSYQEKRLPLPVVKDLLPKPMLSISDKKTTFNRIKHALKLVVSTDEMRPVLKCISVAKDGLVATNGYILFFIEYKTEYEPYLYDPVLERRMVYESTQYPKWKSIVWDTAQAKNHYNVLVLETYSKLKRMAKLFYDDFGRDIVINKHRVSIRYFAKFFKIFYKFGVTACDVYLQKDKDSGIILKGVTKGFEFLGIIMPVGYKDSDALVVNYKFEDLVVEQESVGFLGMM